MKLSKLPNIGSVLEENLKKIGITDSEELLTEGTEKTFKKLRKYYNPDSCINMLYAIEGAIQGKRWHSLSKERKTELKNFYDSLKNDNR